MGTPIKVRYRGKDVDVKITTDTCEKDGVRFICLLDNKEEFEIKFNDQAMWVIVGKPVISKSLVAKIGDAYVNSLMW